MNVRIAMCALLASTLVASVGCKKKEDTTAAASSADATPPPPPAPTGSAAPAPGDVASYPNMTPMGGTVRLLQPFTVHQAADVSSPVLSSLGVGTFVDLKGSYSNWMLVNYPSGVGQLSPGWIELRSINDPRVTQAPKDAGIAVIDAGSTPGHPIIKVIPKHH